MKQTTTRANGPDGLLMLLADQQRRSIIIYFQEAVSEDATLTELAMHICEHSDERVEEVSVKLHHVNLPLLAEAGVVEYDERSETIRYQEDDGIEHLMDCLADL